MPGKRRYVNKLEKSKKNRLFNTKHDRKYLLNNIYNLLYVTTPRMLQSNLKYHIIFVQLLLIITFYTLLCYNQKGNKLPIFDPHRPITLPNLVRALANIPQQKDVNKKNRKRKKDKAISSNLVGQGFKHFSGSYLSNDYLETFSFMLSPKPADVPLSTILESVSRSSFKPLIQCVHFARVSSNLKAPLRALRSGLLGGRRKRQWPHVLPQPQCQAWC